VPLPLAQGADTPAYAHEAGYDAYMTGAAFACLLRLYEAAQQQQEQQKQLEQQEQQEGRRNNDLLANGGGASEGSESEGGSDEEMGCAQQQPSLKGVAEHKWRMNLSR
jgi:hypothetical protein